MKIAHYVFESEKRLDALGASWVRHGEALVVARSGDDGVVLELLKVPGFTTVKRESVDRAATVTQVGETKVVVMAAAERGAKGPNRRRRSFEVRSLEDFGVVTRFVDELPAAVAGSPDGKLIALAHDAGSLNVWDATTGKPVWEHASKGVGAVSFSADGALLAAREVSGTLKIFDGSQPGKPLRSVRVAGEGQLAFHPTQHHVVSATPNGITVVDADSGDIVKKIAAANRKDKDTIGPVAFSMDARLVLTATSITGVVGFWDVDREKFLGDEIELNQRMNRIQFEPSGKWLLLSSYKVAEIYSIAA